MSTGSLRERVAVERMAAGGDALGHLADGRVVAHGTHDELMRDVADYRALIEAFEHDRSDLESPDGAAVTSPALVADDGESVDGGGA